MALPNPGMNFTPYDTLTAAELDNLVENIEALADGTGINDASITQDKLATGADFATGWNVNALPIPTTVVANGNRSYTLTHASSIASTVSVGMRRRFTRQTAANTYMGGAFNGSSHYFTKTSPSGTLGTVTNNFTIEAVVQPTSYASGAICGRADATPNNQFYMSMEADGTVRVAIANGGSTNVRYMNTYQSLPLNKKTHVAASWSSGTLVVYFDGVSVPVGAAVTGGSAPTTAGTGGDFSIGRRGGYVGTYFTGYISNVAVFDAVLSAATIRQHATYKLTGSETNCIGAWSLDNTANDQSSAGNNLTATGGVGYTNISPFGNSGVSSTLEYGLTMSVSSDGLTEVVQCPEGCALPATGGITASAYSSMANPYGWISDKGKWVVGTYAYADTGSLAVSGFGNFMGPSYTITVPIGQWKLSMQAAVEQANTVASGIAWKCGLATSAVASAFVFISRFAAGAATTSLCGTIHRTTDISLSSATAYNCYFISEAGGGTVTYRIFNNALGNEITKLEALPSGL